MSSPHFIMLCGVLLAADPTSTLESAVPGVRVNQASVTPEQLVQAALRQEMEGNPSERQSLLQTVFTVVCVNGVPHGVDSLRAKTPLHKPLNA